MTPGHKFSFKNKLYLLDTTTIDLCLSVFPWVESRKRKGAIKLHMGIDADSHLPAFMDMTDGKVHEINWAKERLKLPKGSFAIFDRGFTDYGWFSSLMRDGIFFVTRLQSNADVEYSLKRAGRKSSAVTNYNRTLVVTEPPVDLKVLHAKIGQLTFENPFKKQKILFRQRGPLLLDQVRRN